MKILLADDEPFVLDVVVRLLQRAGHTVQTAIDGQDALNVFQGESFDIIITDLAMPRLDGLGLAKVVKTRMPGQRVVLLTGSGDNGVLPPNVDFVLEKPMKFDALENLLRGFAA